MTSGLAAVAFAGQAQQLIDQGGGDAVAGEGLGGFEFGNRVEVITEADTLRPHEVLREKRVRVVTDGADPHDYVERYRYRFDWSVPARPPAVARD